MKYLFSVLVLLLFPIQLGAQCLPLAARICLAGDDTTQVWINSDYIGQKDFCDAKAGCDASKLCLPIPLASLQGPLVCLALQTQNVNPVMVYSSWELEIDCAGRKPFVMNSEDPQHSEIKMYWDPKGGANCVGGNPPISDANGHYWMSFQYQPTTDPFQRGGFQVTANTWSATQLKSAQTGNFIPFLSYDPSAGGTGPNQACGVLYWRQVAALPHFLPTYTPTVHWTEIPTERPTSSATPTSTPIPYRTATPTRTWTRFATFTPWPTAVFTATPRPQAPAWRPTIPVHPLPTPQPRQVVNQPAQLLPALPAFQPAPARRWPTATPIPWVPTATPFLHRSVAAPVATKRPRGLPPVEREETLVFSVFPAAFLVNFETGPGHYQLEVVDSNLKAVKVIYDHVVTNEPSAWVEWDGKDSKKYDVRAGQYYVVYFKDGKAIKSLPIARTYKGP